MAVFGMIPRSGRSEEGLGDLFREVERAFDQFSRGWPLLGNASEVALPAAGALLPRMDVAESPDALEVTAEMPGVAEKDLDVRLEGRRLVIEGKREAQREQKDKTFHMVERSSGSFARSITLPFDVDTAKVDASLKDGVLHVRLPKPEAAKSEVKKIAVKAAGNG